MRLQFAESIEFVSKNYSPFASKFDNILVHLLPGQEKIDFPQDNQVCEPKNHNHQGLL